MMSVLTACSPVGLLNAAAPRDGITTTLDVPYAAEPRHGLDIYAPSGAGLPVVVFIYGGGWKDGSKSMYRFVGAALANRGFVTVIPDYRVFPQVRFPDFLRDTARAMAWTKVNIAAYGGDPNRISLMGHSAGAHIAAMLTLDRQWLGAVGLDPDRDMDAMIGLSGPYDFLPLHDPELDLIFAPAGDLRRTQPIVFARGDAVRMLLLTGTADTTVYPRNSENLAARVQAAGGRAVVKEFDGIGHRGIIAAISWPLRWLAPTLDEIVTFLHQHGGRKA